jgi:hypothetical protein
VVLLMLVMALLLLGTVPTYTHNFFFIFPQKDETLRFLTNGFTQ